MCLFPGHHCQEMCLFILIIMFCLLCAPLRGVLHHMLRAGSAPLSFILTQKEAVRSSQQTATPLASHSFPWQSQSKTLSRYTLYVFPNRLTAECVNIYQVGPTSCIFRFIESQWMWRRWAGICCSFFPLAPDFGTII